MNLSIRGWLPALLVLLALAVPVRAAGLTEAEVSNSLMCYACPGEHLSKCQCSGAREMKSVIHGMIGEGKNKQEILGFFAARYGEAILSTPPKKGFALTAYAAPFIGLGVGVMVALFLVLRWSRLGRRDAEAGDVAAAGYSAPPIEAIDKERVARELARLDREG